MEKDALFSALACEQVTHTRMHAHIRLPSSSTQEVGIWITRETTSIPHGGKTTEFTRERLPKIQGDSEGLKFDNTLILDSRYENASFFFFFI